MPDDLRGSELTSPAESRRCTKDGVLEVVLPKAEEWKPKKIKVLSAGEEPETRTEPKQIKAPS